MAKNPKGRGGTSRLRLESQTAPLVSEHPADKLRAMANRRVLPGEKKPRSGPKIVTIRAEQTGE